MTEIFEQLTLKVIHYFHYFDINYLMNTIKTSSKFFAPLLQLLMS